MPTSFQKSVWNSIKKIPKGQITTYGEIAKLIGKPNATRAVGTAVGKNPDAPKTPCHRVILKNGKIGNYSGLGGKSGKQEMLRKEGLLIKNGKIQKKIFPIK